MRKDFSLHPSCRLADFCRCIPRKCAHGEGAPNPRFIQSTRGLRQTVCRPPGSLLVVQTSPNFTDIITNKSLQTEK